MKRENNLPQKREAEIEDEDLIEAVRVACERSTAPVVPSRAVANVEWVTYDPDYVTDRLKEIDGIRKMDSRGWIWWIPEEGEAGGKIDPTSIYWGNVEPEDIPIEIINQHPEFRIPTRAERIEQHGESGILLSLALAVFGFSILLARQRGVSFVQGSEFDLIGGLSLIAGIAFIAFGIMVVAAGQFGQRLNNRGIPRAVKDYLMHRLSDLRSWVPFSVNWEDDSE